MVVTIKEASAFLKLDEFDSAEEAVENQLFELHQQLISKPCIPQLLKARKAKLNQLKAICEVLEIESFNSINSLVINDLNSSNLLDCFNYFQKNKTEILTNLAKSLTIQNLLFTIDLMLLNLKQWAQLWPKITIGAEDKILLSKELESMEFLSILKEMSLINIMTFSDLKKSSLPEKLVNEIKRLNQINSSFSQD